MEKEKNRDLLSILLHKWHYVQMFIYIAIGLTLLVSALGGLGQIWFSYIFPWARGQKSLDVLQILDSLLLISMLAEIMQMVKISLSQRRLFSEPFLVVGLISVVRRVLIITAEGSRYSAQPSYEHTFTLMIAELAVLAVLLVVLVYGIRVLRQQRLDEARRLREEQRQFQDAPTLGELISGQQQ